MAQGDGIAFGIQALNTKTNAGIPHEYEKALTDLLSYEGTPASVSTSTIPNYRLAATRTADGTAFQFSCRRRDRTEYRQVQQIEKSLTLPVEGDDALIKGAKSAFVG